MTRQRNGLHRQDELDSLNLDDLLGRLLPRFLRHFVLRVGTGKASSGDLWQLLKQAEGQVVGAGVGNRT